MAKWPVGSPSGRPRSGQVAGIAAGHSSPSGLAPTVGTVMVNGDTDWLTPAATPCRDDRRRRITWPGPVVAAYAPLLSDWRRLDSDTKPLTLR